MPIVGRPLAYTLNRANHTGTQLASTISDLPKTGGIVIRLGSPSSATVIAAATAIYTLCPRNYLITGWRLMSTVSTTAVLDVRVLTGGASLPSGANSIVAAAPPTLTAATSANSSTLTGWTTSIAKGDSIGVVVTSNTAAVALYLLLEGTHVWP